MTMSSEEFVLRFHSLEGITIGEKRKNLFLLLKNINGSEPSNLEPRNVLEEKFKVDALIYFKKVPELLEYLKSEDLWKIETIFKLKRWFFEAAFGNVSAKDLVTDLFPYLCFNVKVKLLNKLSEVLNDTEQADSIFNSIKSVYGLHLASKLLPACSYGLIIQVMDTLKLPPKQLNLIIKKYPENRDTLLDLLKNYRLENECNKMLKFLKDTDISTFIELHKKLGLSRKLGWRTTNKFLSVNKEAAITDPKTYYKILHNKQIAKSLGNDFPRLIRNLYPVDLEEFFDVSKSILGKLNAIPRKINAFELYSSTFSSTYGSEIWDHSKLITMKLLKVLDPKERDRRIKDEYRPPRVSEEEWKSLYNIKISVPFLKKKISLTSDIKTRADLIGFLVDTCKFNEDEEALRHVCNYILSKHRNDHITVRLAFLKHVLDNFVLEKLEEEHWKPINELLQIFQMNEESFYEDHVFMEGYIHYRLRRKLPIREQLIEWLSKQVNMNLIMTEPEFERFCLIQFGEIISELGKDALLVDYLYALYNFNRRNPNNKIPLFAYPKAIETLKRNVLELKWSPNAYSLLVHFLNNVEPDEKVKYLKLVLAAGNTYSEINTLDNLLTKNPKIILENIEDVLYFILKSRNKHKEVFLRKLRYYHHIGIPQVVVDYCKQYEEYLTNCSRSEKNAFEESAFLMLSLLMTRDDFLAYLFNFYPEESRACGDKNKFRKQKLLCHNIRNISPASAAVPAILHFCKGDYFKLVLSTLYSICGNVNENNLSSVWDTLSERPVSIQKHCLHLSFRYGNQRCIYTTIAKFMEIKTSVSVRKFILKVLFNFFSKNPDDYNWILLKRSVGTLDESDTEAFDYFLQISKVPKPYLTQYQIFAWDVLYELPNPSGVLDSKRALVLNSVDSEGIQRLPDDFCGKIITNLFHSDDVDDFHSSVQSFACRYVVYCAYKDEQHERLKSIFAMLQYYIKNKWSNPVYRDKARNYCSRFLKAFCSEFLNGHNEVDVLRKFSEMWNNILHPHEAFGDYLHLQFTLMHLEKYPVEEFAKKFLAFCNDLTTTYGLVIIEILYNAFSNFLNTCLKRKGEDFEYNRYKFIEHLMVLSKSDTGMLMAALLLDDDDASLDNKTKEIRSGIIDTLGNKKNRIIDLFLLRNIRGTTTLHYY